jgi:hypothetical protein
MPWSSMPPLKIIYKKKISCCSAKHKIISTQPYCPTHGRCAPLLLGSLAKTQTIGLYPLVVENERWWTETSIYTIKSGLICICNIWLLGSGWKLGTGMAVCHTTYRCTRYSWVVYNWDGSVKDQGRGQLALPTFYELCTRLCSVKVYRPSHRMFEHMYGVLNINYLQN